LTSKPVGVALAGVGAWGSNLARNFAALPESRLLWICDTDPKACARAAARIPGVRTAATLAEALEDREVEAVVVSASAAAHHALARQALAAGRDVYVEKPMALTVEDAADLVEQAEAGDRILMVGHLLLYHPAVNRMKALIDAGDLGRLYYVYSQRVNLGTIRKDENALWSFAPHDISVMNHFLDGVPEDVSARGESYLRPGIVDVVFLNMRYTGGRMAQIQISWLDPHKIRKFTIVGSRKMAVFDDMESTEKVRIYDKGVEGGGVVSYNESLTLRFGDILIPKIDMAEPLRLECQHFAACVRQRSRPITDGTKGLEVVRVLAAAQRSLDRNGEPVRL
jgi:predicted dehydrogenase